MSRQAKSDKKKKKSESERVEGVRKSEKSELPIYTKHYARRKNL